MPFAVLASVRSHEGIELHFGGCDPAMMPVVRLVKVTKLLVQHQRTREVELDCVAMETPITNITN